jgi:hypothetical protein
MMSNAHGHDDDDDDDAYTPKNPPADVMLQSSALRRLRIDYSLMLDDKEDLGISVRGAKTLGEISYRPDVQRQKILGDQAHL